MNAIRFILQDLDMEEEPHPKRILIDVLTLREEVKELSELQARLSAAEALFTKWHSKYLKLNNEEASWDDCSNELEDALQAQTPQNAGAEEQEA